MRVQPAVEIGTGSEFEQRFAERLDAGELEHADSFFLGGSQRPKPAPELLKDEFDLSLLSSLEDTLLSSLEDTLLAPLAAAPEDAQLDKGVG